MDRKRYLQSLGWRLWFRVSPEERKQVLSDYSEYFDSGAQEGRSEAELCARFGDPRTIADEVTAPNGGKLVLPRRALLLTVVGVLFLLVNTWHIQIGQILYWDSPINWMFPAIFLLSAASIWFCRKEIGGRAGQRGDCWFAALAVPFALAVFSMNWTLNHIMMFLLDWIEKYNIEPQTVGPTYAGFLQIVLIIVTVVWALLILCVRRLRPWMLTAFPCCAAALYLNLTSIYLLGNMADTSSLGPAVRENQCLALWQLASVLLVPLLLWLRNRKAPMTQ